MKKRALFLIPLAVLAVLALGVGLFVGFGSRLTSYYGTQKNPQSVAKNIQAMQNLQEDMSSAFATFYGGKAQPIYIDRQSIVRYSFLYHLSKQAECDAGKTKYKDIYNLTITGLDEAPAQDQVNKDLPKIVTMLSETDKLKAVGNAIVDTTQHFRVIATVTPGDPSTLQIRFATALYNDSADRTAYKCYPVNQVPASDLKELG